MRRYVLIVGMLISMVSLGCGSSGQVRLSRDFIDTHARARKVVVMKFESRAFDRQRTGSIAWGIVKVPNASEAFPALVAYSVDGHLGMSTVTRAKMKETLKLARVKEDDLLKRRDIKKIRELFGADAMIVGRVDVWKTSYVLFFPKGSVAFAIQCLDLKTGKMLWEIRTRFSMSGTDDRTTALNALKESVEKLEQAVKSKQAVLEY